MYYWEIKFRPPQMETLLIIVFTSASLWGCLSCESFKGHFPRTRKTHECVSKITRTQALTWFLNAVSATCWGSFSDLCLPGLVRGSHSNSHLDHMLLKHERGFEMCDVIGITLTWAPTCLLNSVSATCWGSFNWHEQLNVWEDICFRNHSQITSNRSTDDFCVHKCFSLGLS